ncbi:hypothetical protein GCM10025794_36900 [Massilia kyonggiensis]
MSGEWLGNLADNNGHEVAQGVLIGRESKHRPDEADCEELEDANKDSK